MPGHLRSAVLGGAVVAILSTGASAIAGSGVGGIFNLGQTNTVNETTRLTGAKAGPQLDVANTSTGTGSTPLRLTPATGKAPLATASRTKVDNLNADLLDGLSAISISRASYAQRQDFFFFEQGRTTLARTRIVVPQDGFVLLAGGAMATYSAPSDGALAHVRFRDTTTGTDTSARGATGTSGPFTHLPLQHSILLKAAKGTRTYELIGSWYDTTGSRVPNFYDPSITAQFIPFNGAGTTADVNDIDLAATATAAKAAATPAGAVR